MILRIINAIRLGVMRKIKSGKCCKLAWSAKVIAGKNGRVTIGSGLHVLRNTTIHADRGEIVIGNGCFVNEGTLIVSHEKITIGDHVKIGPHVCIYDHDHDIHDLEQYQSSPVVIGNNVWIGAGAIILRGSRIGDGAVVAAGTIVRGEVPGGTVVYDKRIRVVKEMGCKEICG